MNDRTAEAPRKRKRDVRSAVLLLLAERPMTGSEMIEELSVRSGGEWQPTAATVYPMLQMLEDDALVVVAQSDDGKRRYRLTEAGRAEVERIDETSSRRPWEPPPSEGPADLFVAIAETARVLLGAAATATDEQRADLVTLLEDLRRRIATMVPETKAKGGRGRSGRGWPINIPDWVFGGGGAGTPGSGIPGPFGGNWPWWLGGENEQGESHVSAGTANEEEAEEEGDEPV